MSGTMLESGDISGGIRAIYYWKKSDHEIWMLTLYSKSERASIPGHTLKQIAEAIKSKRVRTPIYLI